MAWCQCAAAPAGPGDGLGGGQGSPCRPDLDGVYNPPPMNDYRKSAAVGPAVTSLGSADEARRRLLVVTGLSGAGHTTALKILEDLGYEAVDNLPLVLLGGITIQSGDCERAIAISPRTP